MGDLVEIAQGPCVCGDESTLLKGGVLARVGRQIKLRAALIYPEVIERTIRRYSKAKEYMIICTKHKNVDMLNVFVELPLTADYDYFLSMARGLENLLGFSPRIFPVFPKSLPRFGFGKAKRFYDNRPNTKLPFSKRRLIFSNLFVRILIINNWRNRLIKFSKTLFQ